MESFRWDDHFVTGLPSVDEQHQHLVGIVNNFGTSVAENRLSPEELQRLFSQLAEYAEFHFRDEEDLMKRAGIDQRHYVEHVHIHRQFLREVDQLYAGVNVQSLDSAAQLLDYLTHWLAYHILGEDQDMAGQLEAIQTGMSPERAYELRENERDNATEPLLKALNGLFAQVSARNRELVELNQSLEEKVAERTRELNEANLHLQELSLTDALTGLPNRRHAMRQLTTLWDEAVEHRLPLVCILIDADHFKEVNDTHGHDAGDEVLTELARTLKGAVRTDDLVCRLGGDEFFVICPNTDQDGGMLVGEAMRQHVAQLKVPTGDGHWVGSISVGVASRSEQVGDFEALIKLADDSVYAAKRAGKNCVRSVT